MSFSPTGIEVLSTAAVFTPATAFTPESPAWLLSQYFFKRQSPPQSSTAEHSSIRELHRRAQLHHRAPPQSSTTEQSSIIELHRRAPPQSTAPS
ncbi:unnamed protein product [Gadus morhua 'NCC']